MCLVFQAIRHIQSDCSPVGGCHAQCWELCTTINHVLCLDWGFSSDLCDTVWRMLPAPGCLVVWLISAHCQNPPEAKFSGAYSLSINAELFQAQCSCIFSERDLSYVEHKGALLWLGGLKCPIMALSCFLSRPLNPWWQPVSAANNPRRELWAKGSSLG